MDEVDSDHRAVHAFVIADARVALLEASQDADLLVLGARGRGRLAAMLLGSTTTWMLNGATRATVVVPSPDRITD
jgi:nucleotide-binding universal stress UspA family protein